MNRTLPLITGAALLLAASLSFLLDAHAGPQDPPPSEIRQLILAQARPANSGVILAISRRGGQAAQAAYLLAVQSRQNPHYAPLLLVSEEQPLQHQLAELQLAPEQLPALIFFTPQGREVSRVVAASEAAEARAQAIDVAQLQRSARPQSRP
jgi:hypothetical protein